jgi:hypothetical protein
MGKTTKRATGKRQKEETARLPTHTRNNTWRSTPSKSVNKQRYEPHIEFSKRSMLYDNGKWSAQANVNRTRLHQSTILSTGLIHHLPLIAITATGGQRYGVVQRALFAMNPGPIYWNVPAARHGHVQYASRRYAQRSAT